MLAHHRTGRDACSTIPKQCGAGLRALRLLTPHRLSACRACLCRPSFCLSSLGYAAEECRSGRDDNKLEPSMDLCRAKLCNSLPYEGKSIPSQIVQTPGTGFQPVKACAMVRRSWSGKPRPIMTNWLAWDCFTTSGRSFWNDRLEVTLPLSHAASRLLWLGPQGRIGNHGISTNLSRFAR